MRRRIDVGCDGEVNKIQNLTDHVHLLPCSVKHNGPCPVSHYVKPFQTGVMMDGMEVIEASFRGRKLQGARIPLPKEYCGFVLEKKSVGKGKGKVSDLSEENSICWKARAKFENIAYWNHDSLPSKDDALVRCFHWFSVANVLHKPVTKDDVDSLATNRDK